MIDQIERAGEVARRSIVRSLRQPGVIVPGLLFPMMLLAINTGGLQSVTRIPGFPTHSYLDFAIGFSFVQGSAFATMNAGTDVARDIETGFLGRLGMTAISRPALVAGQLAGSVAVAMLQGLTYLVVALVAGADLRAGVGGVLVLLALVFMIALAFSSIGIVMALRTGSGEAVQGMFPLIFALMFLSSMALPRNLIEIRWFRVAATANPVSYLIEGPRSLFVTGWDSQALLLAFGVSGAIACAGVAGATLAMRRRLLRT